MEKKVKLLFIANRKMKKDDEKNTRKLFEEYAPGLYDIFTSVGAKESIEQVILHHPEIIVLNDNVKGAQELLKKIKQIHPKATVFVFVSIVEDEQRVIDEYTACGAYKCYMPPIVMDSLVHDMYVALNLE